MQYYWVDAIIVFVIVYHIYDGWQRGSLSLLSYTASFLASLWLALKFYMQAGAFLAGKFGISPSWANVIGYVAIALLSQVVIEELLSWGMRKLPEKAHVSRVNRWLGAGLSAANGVLIVSFFLLLMLVLPLRGTIKQDIRASVLGSKLVDVAEKYGGAAKSSLEKIANTAVRFLTVEPGSNQQIPLDIPAGGISFVTDAKAESQMITLVNKERTDRGLPALVYDPVITEVARGKSRDMFDRRYFSHYDPDGKNAADRMQAARVSYTLVGENLAYAPDLTSAHTGLMNSEGHRANILEPEFGRIGIGVIDGGAYGKMFTQIFAD